MKEFFLQLKTNWPNKTCFSLILLGVLSLGFSKTIWISFPDFYFGKFSYLTTTNITISSLLILLASTFGILLNRSQLNLKINLTLILSLIFLILSFYKKDANYFNYLSLFLLLIYAQIFTQKDRAKILKYCCLGIIFQVCLAIFQFTFQASTNLSILHFLGEPNLNLTTKGISKISVQTFNFIRSYGTTNHPNFLANLILISLIFSPKQKILKYLGFATTFSGSNLMGLTIFKLQQKSFILIGLLTILILLKLQDPNYLGIIERWQQIQTFFSSQYDLIQILIGQNQSYTVNPLQKLLPWEATPIHNHYLLIIQTYGILGLTLAILLSKKLINQNLKIFLILVPVLLLDHFYLTLANGILLLGFIFIFSKESSITTHKI